MVEDNTGLYLVRLFAFLLILGAIVDKNRTSGMTKGPSSSHYTCWFTHSDTPVTRPRFTSATRSLRA